MVDIDEKKKTFMARQPIFDRNKNIYGYELLFRHGLENFFDETLDKDFASSKVLLDSFLVFDLNELTRGKRAFLNFTERVLLSEVAKSFHQNTIIIELLEMIEPTPEIIAVCTKLKNNGYLLALDDFQFHPRYQPLIQLADIIKVDFQLTNEEKERQDVIKQGGDRVMYLAEKVETLDEYNLAREMGYTYFQGYYFSKPVIVAGKEIPSHKLNLVQILKEIHQPEMDFNQLGKIIQRDVSLSYKLLRFINSAAFGIPNEIHSIRHALNLLGINEFKKWISLVLLSQIGSDKPNELMINSLIRAKFCELTAESIGQKAKESDFFLMGLFSLIDAFLDHPMAEILRELPIPGDVKAAILEEEQQGKLGQVLRLIAHYEKSKWDTVTQVAAQLNIPESEVLSHYLTSIKWANECSF
jgi:EAL and modified HD-GYP domain-containing signal transduction protein